MMGNLDKIDALTAAATPGPWFSNGGQQPGGEPLWVAWISPSETLALFNEADAEFIAQARTLVPELVAELRTTRTQLAEWKTMAVTSTKGELTALRERDAALARIDKALDILSLRPMTKNLAVAQIGVAVRALAEGNES